MSFYPRLGFTPCSPNNQNMVQKLTHYPDDAILKRAARLNVKNALMKTVSTPKKYEFSLDICP
jgi:hypothetical protein